MTSTKTNIHKLPSTQPQQVESLTDSELNNAIEQAKKGNVDAFKVLYKQYLKMVYGLCFRLCADKSQAEDATQEVFIQLWQKIHNFDDRSKFSTWLHSVASNVCISYIRKQKSWWQNMFSMNDETNHQQQYSGEINADAFEAMVLRLPERTRIVFVLHAIEGYRHEQVASMLSIAPNTSKVQFHRARTLLEEWVNE
jgi:RNA polymerase sigma-70 factor (ECF subfamily)